MTVEEKRESSFWRKWKGNKIISGKENYSAAKSTVIRVITSKLAELSSK